MKDSSYADRRIIDRLNAELSAIPVPARPSPRAPQRASGTLPALFAVAAIVAAIAFVALRFVPAVSDKASSQVSPVACPATTTRDASGVITSSGDLGLVELRTATFPGEKLIVLVRRGAVPGDALELRAEAVLPPGGKVMWSTAATPRTTAWGTAVFDVNTKPIGNGGCWRLVRNDGPADDAGIVVDLDRSSPNPLVRCATARPQVEIDAAKLPLRPHSSSIRCVLRLTDSDGFYELADGRGLHVYERAGGLPAKPSASPGASGTRDVGGFPWSWITVNGQTVLYTTLQGNTYVELDVTSSTDVGADVALLANIAESLTP